MSTSYFHNIKKYLLTEMGYTVPITWLTFLGEKEVIPWHNCTLSIMDWIQEAGGIFLIPWSLVIINMRRTCFWDVHVLCTLVVTNICKTVLKWKITHTHIHIYIYMYTHTYVIQKNWDESSLSVLPIPEIMWFIHAVQLYI